jgi:hypothetical protein
MNVCARALAAALREAITLFSVQARLYYSGDQEECQFL